MAELLYRLGRHCARHAWRVVVGWLVVLLASLGAYLAWGGTLTDAVTIPGTATDKATQELEQAMPAAAGGSGTVVFHTQDDSSFSVAQQQQISAALTQVAALDGVAGVVDPFTTEADRATQAEQVAQGQQQLAAGKTQLPEQQAQLDAAQQQLDAQKQQLEDQQAQVQAQLAATTDPQHQAQLQAGLGQIEAGLAQVAQGKAQIDAGYKQLEDATQQLQKQEPQLQYAQAMLDLAKNIRTVSEDGSTAVASIQFTDGTYSVPDTVKDAVQRTVNSALPQGVEADYSGTIANSIAGLIGPSDGIGVVIALIVLVIMLGTIVAAGLPILMALVGVGVGALANLSLSSVVQMSSITPILGVMLGLAVGIDYSLFIVNRHRTNLRHGMEIVESIGLATGTSGNTVVFAGSTVVIALLGLNITGIPFLGLVGDAGAVSIAIAVLVAITLTPAMLRLIGTRVLSKKAWVSIRGRLADGAAPVVTPRPWSTLRAASGAVLAIALLLAVAIPALSMRLGLPDDSSSEPSSTQYRAYELIGQKFGAGVNGPLVVVADLPDAVPADQAQADQLAIAQQLAAQDDVTAVAPVGLSADNQVAVFQVIPGEGPTSQSTEDLVRTLRAMSPLQDGTTIQVAGQASGNIDISEKLADALPIYLAVVVGLSLLILILVLRSIYVPVIATAGFVLTVFAALGGVTAVYQWGWLSSITGVHNPGPVLNFLPTILVGVLFGLAMDYQLFITSGMREARALGDPAKVAVQHGLQAGRAVVTAAAVIMISVFGSFMFSDTTMIRSAGFGLAFGILVDAFVVRMFLVPRLMQLAGDKAWWLPRWLDRLLPNVDIEGAALERKHHAPAGQDVQTPPELVAASAC